MKRKNEEQDNNNKRQTRNSATIKSSEEKSQKTLEMIGFVRERLNINAMDANEILARANESWTTYIFADCTPWFDEIIHCSGLQVPENCRVRQVHGKEVYCTSLTTDRQRIYYIKIFKDGASGTFLSSSYGEATIPIAMRDGIQDIKGNLLYRNPLATNGKVIPISHGLTFIDKQEKFHPGDIHKKIGYFLVTEDAGASAANYQGERWSTLQLAHAILKLLIGFAAADTTKENFRFHFYLGDMNPSNLVFDQNTHTIKLIDFGKSIYIDRLHRYFLMGNRSSSKLPRWIDDVHTVMDALDAFVTGFSQNEQDSSEFTQIKDFVHLSRASFSELFGRFLSLCQLIIGDVDWKTEYNFEPILL
jgi:hypothetical protein